MNKEWEKSGKLHKTIGNFDGGFSRVGTIVISDTVASTCDVCKVLCEPRKPMLFIDGSEGEYIEGKICMKCLKKITEEYDKE